MPRSGKRQPGLTVITSSWLGENGWNPELRLIDETGEVLHKWRVERSEFFQGEEGFKQKMATETDIQGSYLLSNGDVVFNLEYVGLVRMNSCGEVEWTLARGNHHSVARGEDGTFWVPAVSRRRRVGSEKYPNGFPGFGGRKVWVDQILHIDGQGKVLKKLNVLDLLYKNDLERSLFRNGGIYDTHLNDVEPLPSGLADEYPTFEAGDLLVSLRNVNLVLVFDPSSERVKWHTTGPFIQQHDPDFYGNGWVGVFDNNTDGTKRGEVLGGSRIVAFHPQTDSVKVLFPTKLSEPFYTDRRGKWQKLENGNLLLTETRAGRVVEVGPEGRTIWEWVHGGTKSGVPSVTKSTRVDVGREEVASWSCASIDSPQASLSK